MSASTSFLDLPAEIRNEIYQMVAHNDEQVIIHKIKPFSHEIFLPALARVCRQIRAEFPSVYRHEAPKAVKDIELYIDNFDLRNVEAALQRLPKQIPGVERYYRMDIFLNNTFEKNITGLWYILEGKLHAMYRGMGAYTNTAFRVSFNEKSFDASYARHYFLRYAGLFWGLAEGGSKKKGINVMKAVIRALEPPLPKKTSKRRKTAKPMKRKP